MKNNSGFTLIELLVTVLLLSTGLLGLVGLQTAGMKNSISSYNLTQATQLASSMADRMRANLANAGLYANSKYITVTPATAAFTDCSATPAGCTAAQMAENDLFEWNLELTDTNNGLAKTGEIKVCAVPYDGTTCNAPTAATPVFIITISWGENRDDNKDGVIDPNVSFKTEFQL